MTVIGAVLIALILGPTAWLVLRGDRPTNPRKSARRPHLRRSSHRLGNAPPHRQFTGRP